MAVESSRLVAIIASPWVVLAIVLSLLVSTYWMYIKPRLYHPYPAIPSSASIFYTPPWKRRKQFDTDPVHFLRKSFHKLAHKKANIRSKHTSVSHTTVFWTDAVTGYDRPALTIIDPADAKAVVDFVRLETRFASTEASIRSAWLPLGWPPKGVFGRSSSHSKAAERCLRDAFSRDRVRVYHRAVLLACNTKAPSTDDSVQVVDRIVGCAMSQIFFGQEESSLCHLLDQIYSSLLPKFHRCFRALTKSLFRRSCREAEQKIAELMLSRLKHTYSGGGAEEYIQWLVTKSQSDQGMGRFGSAGRESVSNLSFSTVPVSAQAKATPHRGEASSDRDDLELGVRGQPDVKADEQTNERPSNSLSSENDELLAEKLIRNELAEHVLANYLITRILAASALHSTLIHRRHLTPDSANGHIYTNFLPAPLFLCKKTRRECLLGRDIIPKRVNVALATCLLNTRKETGLWTCTSLNHPQTDATNTAYSESAGRLVTTPKTAYSPSYSSFASLLSPSVTGSSLNNSTNLSNVRVVPKSSSTQLLLSKSKSNSNRRLSQEAADPIYAKGPANVSVSDRNTDDGLLQNDCSTCDLEQGQTSNQWSSGYPGTDVYGSPKYSWKSVWPQWNLVNFIVLNAVENLESSGFHITRSEGSCRSSCTEQMTYSKASCLWMPFYQGDWRLSRAARASPEERLGP